MDKRKYVVSFDGLGGSVEVIAKNRHEAVKEASKELGFSGYPLTFLSTLASTRYKDYRQMGRRRKNGG